MHGMKGPICAICGEPAEEGITLIDGISVCAKHLTEDGKIKWQSIGYFRRSVQAEHRVDLLSRIGIRSLLLKSKDPYGNILMVSEKEWDRAQKALEEHQEMFSRCPVCSIEYSAHDIFCPAGGQEEDDRSPEGRN